MLCVSGSTDIIVTSDAVKPLMDAAKIKGLKLSQVAIWV